MLPERLKASLTFADSSLIWNTVHVLSNDNSAHISSGFAPLQLIFEGEGVCLLLRSSFV